MPRYAHTNIIAKNWKRLADFYIKVFTCEILPPQRKQSGAWLSKGTGVSKASLEGVHLRLPGYGEKGPTLEIYQYETMVDRLPTASNKLGLGHLAFEVEDVGNTLDAIVKEGGSTYGEIVERDIEGVGRIVFTYCKDPEGNIIELQNWS